MKPPFRFSARTRVGFSDTDAQGIVYYGRYMPYFDLARVEYHRELGMMRVEGVACDARVRIAGSARDPSETTGQPRSGGNPRLEGFDFVMRAITTDYLAPAHFDDQIEIYCRVARVGRTSVTYEFAAYKTDEDLLMVTAEQTLVLVDLSERKAHPIPDWWRERVEQFEQR